MTITVRLTAATLAICVAVVSHYISQALPGISNLPVICVVLFVGARDVSRESIPTGDDASEQRIKVPRRKPTPQFSISPDHADSFTFPLRHTLPPVALAQPCARRLRRGRRFRPSRWGRRGERRASRGGRRRAG